MIAGVEVVHDRLAEQLNQRIWTDFLDHRDDPDIKRSHWFNGRYENVYLSEAEISTMKELRALLLGHAARLLEKRSAELKCGFWFNAMESGHATTWHTHDDDDELLSCVYYVRVPENSGLLLLEAAGQYQRVTPREGLCVFFPPNLPHAVSENHSADTRLSIAFNFGPA